MTSIDEAETLTYMGGREILPAPLLLKVGIMINLWLSSGFGTISYSGVVKTFRDTKALQLGAMDDTLRQRDQDVSL